LCPKFENQPSFDGNEKFEMKLGWGQSETLGTALNVWEKLVNARQDIYADFWKRDSQVMKIEALITESNSDL
jgi:hypothetical protein